MLSQHIKLKNSYPVPLHGLPLIEKIAFYYVTIYNTANMLNQEQSRYYIEALPSQVSNRLPDIEGLALLEVIGPKGSGKTHTLEATRAGVDDKAIVVAADVTKPLALSRRKEGGEQISLTEMQGEVLRSVVHALPQGDNFGPIKHAVDAAESVDDEERIATNHAWLAGALSYASRKDGGTPVLVTIDDLNSLKTPEQTGFERMTLNPLAKDTSGRVVAVTSGQHEYSPRSHDVRIATGVIETVPVDRADAQEILAIESPLIVSLGMDIAKGHAGGIQHIKAEIETAAQRGETDIAAYLKANKANLTRNIFHSIVDADPIIARAAPDQSTDMITLIQAVALCGGEIDNSEIQSAFYALRDKSSATFSESQLLQLQKNLRASGLSRINRRRTTSKRGELYHTLRPVVTKLAQADLAYSNPQLFEQAVGNLTPTTRGDRDIMRGPATGEEMKRAYSLEGQGVTRELIYGVDGEFFANRGTIFHANNPIRVVR